MQQRREVTEPKIKIKKEEDNSDIESVASEEFEELLDGMLGNKKDLDFSDSIADNFNVSKNNKKNKNQQNGTIMLNYCYTYTHNIIYITSVCVEGGEHIFLQMRFIFCV